MDDNFRLRYATRSLPNGGWELLKFTTKGAPLEIGDRIDYEDADNTRIDALTQDGKTLYMIDSRGRDKSVLKAIAVDTGEGKVLAEDQRADIGGAIHDSITRRVQAYRVSYLRSEWHVLDPSVAADFAFINANVKGEWNPVSRTKDSVRWIIARNDPQAPGEFLLYNRAAKTIGKLFTARPELVGKPLVPMHPLEIKSRDGLTLVSYLTLPAGADTNGDARPERPVPMVLLVHGGPWGRDGYGYNSLHQPKSDS